MRLSDIAETLAPIECRPADELHIQLRNPAMKMLFESAPGRGRTSAADYPARELARARIFLALADCGVTTSELATVNQILDTPPDTSAMPLPPSLALRVVPRGLDCLINGTAAGETWLLSLRVTRNAQGKRRVAPRIRHESWDDLDPLKTSPVDLLYGETLTPKGLIEIPVSDLLAPLTDKLGAE